MHRVRLQARRPQARAVFLACVLAAIAGLATFVIGLNDRANRYGDARHATSALIEDTVRMQGLSWQVAAEQAPDFTVGRELSRASRDARRQRTALRRLIGDDGSLDRLDLLLSTFVGNVEHQQRLAARQPHLLGAFTLTYVDGSAELLQAELSTRRAKFQAQAAAADRSLFRGMLGGVGLAGLLLTLVFVAVERARGRVRRAERRFAALVQRSNDVIAIVARTGEVVYVTDSVATLTGRAAAEVTGRQFTDLLSPDERPAARMRLEALLAGAQSTPSDWSLPHRDGHTLIAQASARDLTGDPAVGGVVITLHDVTDRRKIEDELRHRAFHDPLTGLANRALFEDRAAQALARARRSWSAVWVAFLDLDDFKTVNDSLGHQAGDDLLLQVGRRVAGEMRASDTVARFGGDEFAILLEDLDADEAQVVAERVRAALARPFVVDGRSLTQRASIGIACAQGPAAAIAAADLLRNADIALYAAKAAGKDTVQHFREDLLSAARLRLDLREDLRRAIDRDELRVVYQPLVELDSGAVNGVEALLRWDHPREGPVSPALFIPLAEETGSIVALGRWMLRRALADLRVLEREQSGLRLSVNISARELQEPDLVDAVADALAEHEVAAERVTLEVTESALVDESGPEAQRLRALRALGVRIAVDDFGTGYSSLSYLHRLAVDVVKIDRSFVDAADSGHTEATLVRSIVELSRSLGLDVVAEGIEREEQLTFLRSTECGLGQGFLFARPSSPAELVAHLGAYASRAAVSSRAAR